MEPIDPNRGLGVSAVPVRASLGSDPQPGSAGAATSALQDTGFHRAGPPGWRGVARHALDLLPLDDSLLRARRGRRSHRVDRQLAWSLAFVAGAINAGGFLAVGLYTSHITGAVSRAADEVALGHTRAAAGALALVACFFAGAFTTGFLVQLGGLARLRSRHAVPLAFEAVLLFAFGFGGPFLAGVRLDVLPAAAVLLCYLMGMHNAVVTHISQAVVRTTHMTGIVTDIGIELARWTLRHRRVDLPHTESQALKKRLRLHVLILLSFLAGGVVGALGFKRVGFSVSSIFACSLALLAVRPIALDVALRLRARRLARRAAAGSASGPLG